MKYKTYKGASGDTTYRVQPCGKVEVQYRPGGKWVHDKTLTGSKLNHWRKSGNVARVYSDWHQSDKGRMTARLELITDYLMECDGEHPRELIPVHPNGLIVYERKAMQSIKGDPLTCRGYDGWSAEQGLATINKGLSVLTHLEPRIRVIEREQLALLAKLQHLT